LSDVLTKAEVKVVSLEKDNKYYELTVRNHGLGVEKRIINKKDYITMLELNVSKILFYYFI
ncbi:MAG: hypothetical protein NY202_05830, partial [Mollicutes bacterium UO1]